MYGGGVGGEGYMKISCIKNFLFLYLYITWLGGGMGGGGWLFTRIKTQELVYTYVH